MGAVMGFNSVRKRLDFMEEHTYIGSICAMISKANSLYVSSGVAVYLVEKSRPDGISTIYYEAVNRSFYDEHGNYLSSAMAMIATMKALQTPTGDDGTRLVKGELVRKGGLLKIVGGYTIYIAFDGSCREEQNLEIARLGMAMLFSDEAKG